MRSALLLSTLLAGLAVTSCTTAKTTTTSYDRDVTAPVQTGDSYYVAANAAVDARAQGIAPKKAKNVILFIGDGMGISTLTAGRIYAGQQKGLDGESYKLTIEQLPNVALSKTYAHDGQIADSAATATAMVTGAKVNMRTLGLAQGTRYENCAGSKGKELTSIFEMAEEAGMATGIVSTARITHATPASTYAKSASRNWENDTDLRGQQAAGCKDIAAQLIDWEAGDGFEIALGGGRRNFMTADQADPEYEGKTGRRADGRDLIAEWQGKSPEHTYVWDKASFDAVDFATDKKVLGLFEPSHMQYELDRPKDGAGEPSLADMTRAAITRGSQDEDGYVLMIEGGRVDHGHHANNAKRALTDVGALDDAVKAALELTDPEETLILVTADHSHVFVIAGYSARNNPILGKSATGIGTYNKGADGKPYTTLGYYNGPGSVCVDKNGTTTCLRQDLTNVDTEADDYMQQSLVPMGSETHAGEDVAIFASGPGSDLVNSTMEENEIFHVMAKSLGLIE